jgi:hypothetical protein
VLNKESNYYPCFLLGRQLQGLIDFKKFSANLTTINNLASLHPIAAGPKDVQEEQERIELDSDLTGLHLFQVRPLGDSVKSRGWRSVDT